MSGERYEVRCTNANATSPVLAPGTDLTDWLNTVRPDCAPHTIWRIDADGTEAEVSR